MTDSTQVVASQIWLQAAGTCYENSRFTLKARVGRKTYTFKHSTRCKGWDGARKLILRIVRAGYKLNLEHWA